jgi:hypothetical protein
MAAKKTGNKDNEKHRKESGIEKPTLSMHGANFSVAKAKPDFALIGLCSHSHKVYRK